LGILVQILHAYYTFLSTRDYTFLFNNCNFDEVMPARPSSSQHMRKMSAISRKLTHAGIFWHFSQTGGNFLSKFYKWRISLWNNEWKTSSTSNRPTANVWGRLKMRDWNYRHHTAKGGKCGTKQLWKANAHIFVMSHIMHVKKFNHKINSWKTCT